MKGQKLITEALTCPVYTSISDYYGIFLVISINKDVTVICNLGPPNVNFRALRATRKEKDT